MKKMIFIVAIILLLTINVYSQSDSKNLSEDKTNSTYKKRVLESAEIDLLSSIYTQDGDNAAVTGGIGTEELDDATATIIVSIPVNDDDVLTIDAGVSAYSSASSSNVNPFDSRRVEADAFVASSGESQSDVWSSMSLAYSHNSDDRNNIYSGYLSYSSEYDYSSIGIGASLTKLMNEKNTEITIKGSTFFDKWSRIYPVELRAFGLIGDDDEDEDGGGDDYEYFNIDDHVITGNTNYSPQVTPLAGRDRNSYALGLGFSQILSKRLLGSLTMDMILQKGQLSTPFQRVYFADIEDAFIENFHLADDIERLPSSRLKFAIGGRMNYYINENFVVRSFYRYYKDDWSIESHTASIEIPIKFLLGQLSVYPSYRFYYQSAAEYFGNYNSHLSSSEFYTSDFDLAEYHSHQLGFGIGYNNLYGLTKLWKFNLKSIDLKAYKYDRNTSFNSFLVTLGIKFRIE